MSAVHLHLLSVHLPVIGVFGALGLVLLGHLVRRDLLLITGYGVLLLCAAGAALAYYSGPSAYEQLETQLQPSKAWVEQHAVVGRAFFVALILTAAVALQAMLQFAQEEPPPRWQRYLILALLLLLSYLAAWTAHLGGAIRHEEIRQPEWKLLPHLSGTHLSDTHRPDTHPPDIYWPDSGKAPRTRKNPGGRPPGLFSSRG